MRVDVHVERHVPFRLGRRLHEASGADTGVGKEQIDATKKVPTGLDEPTVAIFGTDVGRPGERRTRSSSLEFGRDAGNGTVVQIRQDHPRPEFMKSAGESGTDSAGRTRDDDARTRELHVLSVFGGGAAELLPPQSTNSVWRAPRRPPDLRRSTPLRCTCATITCVTFGGGNPVVRNQVSIQETAMTSTQVVEPLMVEEVAHDVVAEALVLIDRALSQMVKRELVSSGEVSDLLLDVRNLLTSSRA